MRFPSRAAVLGFTAMALSMLGGILPAQAETRRLEVIERVAAIVDEEVIFLSELRRRAVPFLPQVMQAGSAAERESRLDQLYDQLLERMIDEALLQQAASKMKIRITREEVDRSIEYVRSQSKLDKEAFWDAVLAQGMTESDYRTDVRRQLMAYKVLNQRAGERVKITEEDVRRRYEEQAARESRTVRVHLAHLFLPVAADAGAKQVAEVRAEMDALRAKVTAETFETTMANHPGGDLGWLGEADLPEALRGTVLTMKPKDISAPIRGPNGFHILFLLERDRGSSTMPPYEEVKQKLFLEMSQSAMTKQQDLVIGELRREAVITKRLGKAGE